MCSSKIRRFLLVFLFVFLLCFFLPRAAVAARVGIFLTLVRCVQGRLLKIEKTRTKKHVKHNKRVKNLNSYTN